MNYWYNDTCKKFAITSDVNTDMGEGWVKIKPEEYNKPKESMKEEEKNEQHESN